MRCRLPPAVVRTLQARSVRLPITSKSSGPWHEHAVAVLMSPRSLLPSLAGDGKRRSVIIAVAVVASVAACAAVVGGWALWQVRMRRRAAGTLADASRHSKDKSAHSVREASHRGSQNDQGGHGCEADDAFDAGPVPAATKLDMMLSGGPVTDMGPAAGAPALQAVFSEMPPQLPDIRGVLPGVSERVCAVQVCTLQCWRPALFHRSQPIAPSHMPGSALCALCAAVYYTPFFGVQAGCLSSCHLHLQACMSPFPPPPPPRSPCIRHSRTL